MGFSPGPCQSILVALVRAKSESWNQSGRLRKPYDSNSLLLERVGETAQEHVGRG